MSVSIDTFKCFMGKKEERYISMKKPNSQIEKKILTEPSVNEVMETIMADKNKPSTQDPIGNPTDEYGFNQFSGLTSFISD